MVYTPSLKNMRIFAYSKITLHQQILGQAIVKYSMNYMREYPFHEWLIFETRYVLVSHTVYFNYKISRITMILFFTSIIATYYYNAACIS